MADGDPRSKPCGMMSDACFLSGGAAESVDTVAVFNRTGSSVCAASTSFTL